jgi:methionyl-tRNA synthetase
MRRCQTARWPLRSFRPLRPLYTTTPIFYVNANPHLGHLYSMLLADTRTRWEKLTPGAATFFTTGTDEHGLKVQAVAEAQGVAPQALVDRVSQNFKRLADDMQIDYDRFIRTTDADHVQAVQEFWRQMQQRGLLYRGTHAGWYSVSDETFYPEQQIERRADGRMVSRETGAEVVHQTETNWFFRLGQFRLQLIAHLEAHPHFVLPRSRQDALLQELRAAELDDLSVLRPSLRLQWGIEVPGDALQRVYVWFDALVNYITSVGWPQQPLAGGDGAHATTRGGWPATHVIGKDIMRFHCVYWPIFLLAAELPPPRQVVVHSHWLSHGVKMSKSLGNVVDPVATAHYYGRDALRFFLMEYLNIDADCNYREDQFHFAREKLIGKYANLATRCGGTAFSVLEAVRLAHAGAFAAVDGAIERHALATDVAALLALRDRLVTEANAAFAAMSTSFACFNQQQAIGTWWRVVEAANEFFQLAQPWLYKEPLLLPQHALLRHYFIYLAADATRIASILISPVIPLLAGQILDRLAVHPQHRDARFCRIGADPHYGTGTNDAGHKVPIQRVPMRQDSSL